jgi:uncharacterized NAD(P)/FAD-binding protein YdhS
VIDIDNLGPDESRQYSVAVIGGGFSGTALSVALLDRPQTLRTGGLSLAVIDRGERPCRGVAYGTECRAHILNNPAASMSLMSHQPDHFVQWARSRVTHSVQPGDYLPRCLYGDYLEETLATAIQDHPKTRFDWVHDEVRAIVARKDRVVLHLTSGGSIEAGFAVIATGNGIPVDPAETVGLSPAVYSSYAWSETCLDGIPKNGTVMILGTGLTAIDQLVALHDQSFVGRIVLLSRHGLLPSVHFPSNPWSEAWVATLPDSLRGIVRAIREQIKVAGLGGSDWHSVVDTIRPHTSYIWQALSPDDRQTFLRHVRPYWEIARHKLPPESASLINHLVTSNALLVISGRAISIQELDGKASVELRRRGEDVIERLEVDRILNCTGTTSTRRPEDNLFDQLVDTGIGSLDALGLGLKVGATGELMSNTAVPSDRIYTLGPVRKASFWEVTAVPEIREQASVLAAILCRVACSQMCEV